MRCQPRGCLSLKDKTKSDENAGGGVVMHRYIYFRCAMHSERVQPEEFDFQLVIVMMLLSERIKICLFISALDASSAQGLYALRRAKEAQSFVAEAVGKVVRVETLSTQFACN